MTITEDYPPLTLIDGSVDDDWPYPWVRDGLTYSYCVRCAIRMELPEAQLWAAEPREYCRDCDAPEFRLKPHGWNRMQDVRAVAA